MFVPSPITFPDDRTPAPGHDEANLWRGRFVEAFSLAETVVSEALARLARISPRHAKGLLPQLNGQRFAVLWEVVNDERALGHEGGRVADILMEFEAFQQLRAFLCHGSSVTTVDRQGNWHMELHLLTFRNAAVARDVLALRQEDAVRMLHELRSCRIRLDGQVRGLLASL